MGKVGKMKPLEVRNQLVDALRLDPVGPEFGTDLESEVLPLGFLALVWTGFLVPLEAGEAQKSDETANDDLHSPPSGYACFSPKEVSKNDEDFLKAAHRLRAILHSIARRVDPDRWPHPSFRPITQPAEAVEAS